MTTNRPKSQADWDQRYVEDDLPWDSGIPDIHLRQLVQSTKATPRKVLEIGCGTGTNVIWLAKRGIEVVGLDLSPTAIKMATIKAGEAAVQCQWLTADFLNDSLSGAPFDLIFDRGCFHVFDELRKRDRFAKRVAELLAKDGIWLSIIGSTDGPPRETGPPRLSAQEVATAVEPHFKILNLKSASFDEEDLADIRAWVLHAQRREA